MYNSESKEIAKPTELLNSIKAIMSVLQSIENYGIDRRHFTNLHQLHFVSQSFHTAPPFIVPLVDALF